MKPLTQVDKEWIDKPIRSFQGTNVVNVSLYALHTRGHAIKPIGALT